MLYVLHMVLAYVSNGYWMHLYANFSLTIFLYIGNYTMQSYIVLKLVTKGNGQRYLPNFLFWGFCMIAQIIEVAVVEVHSRIF
jgi:hypothetical protein